MNKALHQGNNPILIIKADKLSGIKVVNIAKKAGIETLAIATMPDE